MYVLGINAAFHDSSAALLQNGIPVAAAEEERFTRIKHAKRPMPMLSYQLPFHAIAYCLDEAGIGLRDLSCIAYSYQPNLARDGGNKLDNWDSGFGRWGETFLAGVTAAPHLLRDDVPHHLARLLKGVETYADLPPFEFVAHHMAHAASAFFVSGFNQSAILTLDGRGERTTSMAGFGDGGSITPLSATPYPHSLGLLYEDVTAHLGFLRSSDEYKVMALASSGTPRFVREFERVVSVHEGGRYTVGDAQLERFAARRRPGESLEQKHFDLAYALQHTLEGAALDLARWLHERTGSPNLCMAGGVALNCVMNARIRDDGPFQRMFVQPAAGDAGTALGAAFLAHFAYGGEIPSYIMHDAFLGPSFSDADITSALDRAGVEYTRPESISDATAELLAHDRIVAWFQGRMEFGPRALGSRSIVAAPSDPHMKDRLNHIKDREEFRPVAPAVLAERAGEYFDPAIDDPFMLFVSRVRPERADTVPAICHTDGTARVQTVSRAHAPAFHSLISAFARRSGIPVIVNTSLNTLGRPIVCTPQDALECYFTSPLDALAIGPYLLTKPKAGSLT